MSHLSTLNPLSLDPLRPTLFELISSEQLSALLSPSARYILAYFASRHPRYLLKLVLKFDELYLLIAGLIEYRCLKVWNSSLTESFYDLSRRRTLRAGKAALAASGYAKPVKDRLERLSELRNKEIFGSLFFLVGVPYLKEKLDRYHSYLQSQSLLGSRRALPQDASGLVVLKYRLAQIFLRYYPTIKFTSETFTIILNILYLFGKVESHSIVDALLGIKYVRQSGPAFSLPKDSESTPSRRPTSSRTQLILSRGADIALSSVLPMAVFALKFTEWWYASDFARQLSQSTRRQRASIQDDDADLILNNKADQNIKNPCVLDPPIRINSPENNDAKEKNTALCPLCSSEINNPAIIETGKVFCYNCIYSYISNTPQDASCVRCPVTNQRLLNCKYDDVMEKWTSGSLRRLIV
ncbi:Pex12 amino terminal region-domain-containing protein [Dipodascopsis uninucleata]